VVQLEKDQNKNELLDTKVSDQETRKGDIMVSAVLLLLMKHLVTPPRREERRNRQTVTDGKSNQRAGFVLLDAPSRKQAREAMAGSNIV